MTFITRALAALLALVLAPAVVLGQAGVPVVTYSGATTPNDIVIFENTTGKTVSSGYHLLDSFDANSVLGNPTGTTASTIAQIPIPSCNANNGQWLQYISGTGFSCSSGNWRLYKNAASVGSFTAGTTGSEKLIVGLKVADAGTLGTSGCVRVSTLWSFTNSANNKTLIMRYGSQSASTADPPTGTAIFSSTQTSQQNGWDYRTICNNASASAQRVAGGAWGIMGGTSGGTSTTYKTNTVDTAANDLYVSYSVNLSTSTESVSIDRVILEFMPGVP